MSTEIRTTDELWSALEQSGASARYSKLLHGITIEALEPFFEAAECVLTKPDIVAPLILDSNWRVTLLGTALANLIWSERLAAPMVERLTQGSWVAPQLAAGIGSLPSENVDLSPLRQLLESCDSVSEPKTVMSAYAALAVKHDPAARSFESTELFSTLWRVDEVRCYQLAVRWHGIWGIARAYFHRRIGTAEPAI